jgi:hypothetical protein
LKIFLLKSVTKVTQFFLMEKKQDRIFIYFYKKSDLLIVADHFQAIDEESSSENGQKH